MPGLFWSRHHECVSRCCDDVHAASYGGGSRRRLVTHEHILLHETIRFALWLCAGMRGADLRAFMERKEKSLFTPVTMVCANSGLDQKNKTIQRTPKPYLCSRICTSLIRTYREHCTQLNRRISVLHSNASRRRWGSKISAVSKSGWMNLDPRNVIEHTIWKPGVNDRMYFRKTRAVQNLLHIFAIYILVSNASLAYNTCQPVPILKRK